MWVCISQKYDCLHTLHCCWSMLLSFLTVKLVYSSHNFIPLFAQKLSGMLVHYMINGNKVVYIVNKFSYYYRKVSKQVGIWRTIFFWQKFTIISCTVFATSYIYNSCGGDDDDDGVILMMLFSSLLKGDILHPLSVHMG